MIRHRAALVPRRHPLADLRADRLHRPVEHGRGVRARAAESGKRGESEEEPRHGACDAASAGGRTPGRDRFRRVTEDAATHVRPGRAAARARRDLRGGRPRLRRACLAGVRRSAASSAVTSLRVSRSGVSFGLPVIALVFTASFAAAHAGRRGRRLGEAWAAVGRQAPTLLVLPRSRDVRSRSRCQLFLVLVACVWLALPASRSPSRCRGAQPGGGSRASSSRCAARSSLARAEYLHALGVIAALVIVDAFLA